MVQKPQRNRILNIDKRKIIFWQNTMKLFSELEIFWDFSSFKFATLFYIQPYLSVSKRIFIEVEHFSKSDQMEKEWRNINPFPFKK